MTKEFFPIYSYSNPCCLSNAYPDSLGNLTIIRIYAFIVMQPKEPMQVQPLLQLLVSSKNNKVR